MKTRVLDARKVLFVGETTEVVLPGEDGELSVWDFHQPCICRLKYGRIRITSRDAADGSARHQEILIKEGIMRVDLLGMAVLVEEAGKKEV